MEISRHTILLLLFLIYFCFASPTEKIAKTIDDRFEYPPDMMSWKENVETSIFFQQSFISYTNEHLPTNNLFEFRNIPQSQIVNYNDDFDDFDDSEDSENFENSDHDYGILVQNELDANLIPFHDTLHHDFIEDYNDDK